VTPRVRDPLPDPRSGPPSLGLPFRALVPGWAREPSSRGLGRPVIPTDVGQGVHSRSSFRDSFGRTVPTVRSRSAFAVSHCLGDFLHLGFAGLLRPAAGRMFAAFHGFETLGSLPRIVDLLLATLFTPFEELLVDSRTASPRSVPSCRLLRLQGGAGKDEGLVSEAHGRFAARSNREPIASQRASRAGRSARAALPGSVSPRASEPWSADTRGFPQIPDDDSVVRCRPRRSAGTGAMGPSRVPSAPPLEGATLGSVRIPTPSLSAVRWRRARLGRHARARTARPPLGAWSGSARLSVRLPGRRRRSLVPVRCVARGWSTVPSSRSTRTAGQGRGLASSTRGARAPHGWWPHPRRSTSTHPSGVRGSPPNRAGARAPSRSPHGCRSPCGHPACASRRQSSSAVGREARASRTHRVEPASRRDSSETSAKGQPGAARATPADPRPSSAHADLARSCFSRSFLEPRSRGLAPSVAGGSRSFPGPP